MDTAFLWEVLTRILPGLPLLFQLVGLSVGMGVFLALLLALMRLSGLAILDVPARLYVFVFRGTPLLIQIFLIYYGLAQFPEIRQSALWPYLRDPFWCAVLAFTLNTGAYASEILRGALLSVPHGQIEAARACGMSRLLIARRIVLPIALRQALPGYSNEIIIMVKATSLASVVTLFEVTGLARKLISETFRVVEVFLVAAVIYLILNFLLTRALLALEWWLSPHMRAAPSARATSRNLHARSPA